MSSPAVGDADALTVRATRRCGTILGRYIAAGIHGLRGPGEERYWSPTGLPRRWREGLAGPL